MRYAGWPVLRKLEYVDKAMSGLRERPQLVRTRRTPDALSSLRRTLRRHYQRRRQHYGVVSRRLRPLAVEAFSSPDHAGPSPLFPSVSASLPPRVQRGTGEDQYLIDHCSRT